MSVHKGCKDSAAQCLKVCACVHDDGNDAINVAGLLIIKEDVRLSTIYLQ